jgi:hypothetical protein
MDQVLTYDPEGQAEPVQNLVLMCRSMRIGQRVELANGTVIKAVGVPKGAGKERRFVVLPKGADALTRHRRSTLGHKVAPSATHAAMQALGKNERE